MKNIVLLLIISGIFVASSCSKNEPSERFLLLTGHIWTADSLTSNGVDASGPGGLLEKFKGDARFIDDGSGYFGNYEGTWRFNADESQLVILTDSLPLPIISTIIELTDISFKVKTFVPNPVLPTELLRIRMTFKAK